MSQRINDSAEKKPIRIPHVGGFRWEGVPIKEYKADGSHFRSITRQTLCRDDTSPYEVRYLEIEPGGYSTLERHTHAHCVIIVRGRGHVLIDTDVMPMYTFDVVRVPPLAWHQFRATENVPLGFLCVVASERDTPVRPTEEELEELRRDPDVAAFVKV